MRRDLWMEKKLCEKERLMFQAVIELIEEGMDIYSMKVSDITSREIGRAHV